MAAGINSMQSIVMQIMRVLREAIGGYGFSPTEEELLSYLKSENPGYREDFCIIPRIGNIYEINPWDLPEKFNEKSIIPSNGREWWFICPHTQNQRNCRKTPSDYSWKITGKSTDIKIDGQKIGSKKIFVFPEGRGSKGSKSSKSLWLIHEYRLPDENICKSDRDYVLCHLKLKQDELCLPQTDDAGSLPKLMIQETMESLRKSAQPQNRAQFSLPDLLQLFQRGLQSQNNCFHSNINQVTNIGSSPANDFSLDNGHTDKSIKFESLRGTTKDDRRVDSLLTEDPFDDEVQKGEEPRVEKVHQETTARNIGPCMSSYEAEAIAKLNRNYAPSHLKHKQDDSRTDNAGSSPEHVIQARMETRRQSTQHQHPAEFSSRDLLHLAQPRLHSQNNSFHSNTHQLTNTGSSSVKNFSLDDGLTDKSIELKSLLGTTKDHERVDTLSNENRFDAEVQKGEAPRLEKVQQETAARNIKPWISSNEATARAENRNYAPSHLKHKQDDSRTDNAGSSPEHVIQARMETQRQSTQHQNPAEFSSRDLLHLAQPGLHSQNNSFHSNTHQLTNTGSSSVKNFSLDDGLTDKSIELKSLPGTTKDHERVDTLSNENRFDAEVQKGEAPRLEKVQQETAARNIKPWISSNEATARAELNRNYAPSHLKHKQDDSRTDNAGSSPEHVIQARMETQRQSTQHQNPAEFSSRDLLHLAQPGLHSQNNSFHSNTHQLTNTGSSSVKNFSLDDGLTDKSIELKSLLGTTKDHERVDTLSNENRFDAEVQKGEAPRLEKVQQETAARNIKPWISSNEATARAELNRNYAPSHLKHKQDDSRTDNAGSSPEHVIQARMETQRQSTQHQHPAEFSSRDLLHLAQPGLHSQNNSFHSNTHQLTNTGSSSVQNFSLDDGLTDKYIELKSLLGRTKDHERVDTLSNENRFDAEVQKGEAPRLEKVQQETAARNIKPWISSNEATARAELNRNYAPSHLKHKQDDSRTDNAGSFPEHVIQARMETQRQSTQHQNPAEFSSRDLLHLVQPGLHSQNNSSGEDFSLDDTLTDKSIELKSLLRTTNEDEWVDAMPDADLSYAQVQNGEEPHKSIQFEFPFFRTKDEEWADSLIVDYSSDTEVQNGEEPCFEKVQQELEHEEYNLAGNPSKRRRLEVSEENQIQ